MLLTSTEWKRRTRYELTLKFSGRGNINVSQVTTDLRCQYLYFCTTQLVHLYELLTKPRCC